MATLCGFCDDPIEPGEAVRIEAQDDPYGRFDTEEGIAHDECLRRHRAAVEQARRMFKPKPKGPFHAEAVHEDIDEDELQEEVERIEETLDSILDEIRDENSA